MDVEEVAREIVLERFSEEIDFLSVNEMMYDNYTEFEEMSEEDQNETVRKVLDRAGELLGELESVFEKENNE